jgi:hypothetical protein
VIHPEYQDALKCHEYDEPVSKHVVIEGAQELGGKKRREPALFE